jgi:hypothetical protein
MSRSTTWLALWLGVLSAVSAAAQASLPRSTTLSDGWVFQPDPNRIGDAQHWERPDLDRGGWRAVTVPMAWDQYDPVMDGYEGVGWYAPLPASLVDTVAAA